MAERVLGCGGEEVRSVKARREEWVIRVFKAGAIEVEGWGVRSWAVQRRRRVV